MIQPFARGGALLAALLITTPLAAQAAPGQDQMFVRKAAQGGLAEVREAHVALNNSRNPGVIRFANRMITDHTANNAQLARIAHQEGRPLPPTIGARNEQIVATLQTLHGRAFDRQYVQGQVAGHEQMLSLLQNEVASGSDPRLVAFARATIPVVREHLSLARRLSSMMSGM
jgi:putative membrane protein